MYSFTENAKLTVYSFGVKVEIPSRYIQAITVEESPKWNVQIVIKDVRRFTSCEDRAIYDALNTCYLIIVEDLGYKNVFHEPVLTGIYGTLTMDDGTVNFYSRTVTADFEFRDLITEKPCNQ